MRASIVSVTAADDMAPALILAAMSTSEVKGMSLLASMRLSLESGGFGEPEARADGGNSGRRFEGGADLEQRRYVERPAAELHAHGQAVGGKAPRQGERRAAGDVEGVVHHPGEAAGIGTEGAEGGGGRQCRRRPQRVVALQHRIERGGRLAPQ